jgi:hypothetical protein
MPFNPEQHLVHDVDHAVRLVHGYIAAPPTMTVPEAPVGPVPGDDILPFMLEAQAPSRERAARMMAIFIGCSCTDGKLRPPDGGRSANASTSYAANAPVDAASVKIHRRAAGQGPAMKRWLIVLACLLAPSLPSQAQQRGNFFGDPFLSVTSSMPACPQPLGPAVTQAEVREQAHVRAQHGGSCFRAGRCRLPNSYLYDAEIAPRVALAIRQDGRLDDTSIWVAGERRLVTLMGCVQSAQQAQAAERLVLLIDDVMGVINLLMVGTQGVPTYEIKP